MSFVLSSSRIMPGAPSSASRDARETGEPSGCVARLARPGPPDAARPLAPSSATSGVAPVEGDPPAASVRRQQAWSCRPIRLHSSSLVLHVISGLL